MALVFEDGGVGGGWWWGVFDGGLLVLTSVKQ